MKSPTNPKATSSSSKAPPSVAVKSFKEKLFSLMVHCDYVSKDKKNTFHKYDYAGEAAIKEKFREGLIQERLLCLPDQKEVVSERNPKGDGNLTRIKIDFKIIDIDSDSEVVFPAFGAGEDKGDKGLYKAITGAIKYFVFSFTLMPTGDDPEKPPKSTPEMPPEAINPTPTGATGKNNKVDDVSVADFKVEPEKNDFSPDDDPKHDLRGSEEVQMITTLQRRQIYAMLIEMLANSGIKDVESKQVSGFIRHIFGVQSSTDVPADFIHTFNGRIHTPWKIFRFIFNDHAKRNGHDKSCG